MSAGCGLVWVLRASVARHVMDVQRWVHVTAAVVSSLPLGELHSCCTYTGVLQVICELLAGCSHCYVCWMLSTMLSCRGMSSKVAAISGGALCEAPERGLVVLHA